MQRRRHDRSAGRQEPEALGHGRQIPCRYGSPRHTAGGRINDPARRPYASAFCVALIRHEVSRLCGVGGHDDRRSERPVANAPTMTATTNAASVPSRPNKRANTARRKRGVVSLLLAFVALTASASHVQASSVFLRGSRVGNNADLFPGASAILNIANSVTSGRDTLSVTTD